MKPEHCSYCNHEMNYRKNDPFCRSEDHVVPKSMGGREIRYVCRTCNTAKGHMPLAQFEYFLEFCRRPGGTYDYEMLRMVCANWHHEHWRSTNVTREEMHEAIKDRDWASWNDDGYDEALGKPMEGTLAHMQRRGEIA